MKGLSKIQKIFVKYLDNISRCDRIIVQDDTGRNKRVEIYIILCYNKCRNAYTKQGGIDMKTKMMDLKKQAKQLVLISKQKNIIKPHTDAFKEFPTSEEKHKGKREEENK